MKLKFTSLLFLFVLLGISVMHLQAQSLSLNIKQTDNTEKSIQLSALKKITFSGTDMTLNYQAGTIENIGISLIQKIVFGPFTALSNTLVDDTSLAVYPNPSFDFIILKNLPENSANIAVYSINGTEIMNLSAPTQKIDVSHLVKGVYLIKVNNQVSKFIKL
jgi:hypothetical protein